MPSTQQETTELSQEMQSVIINMLMNHEPPTVIRHYTGISQECIETIQKQQKPKRTKKDSVSKKLFGNKAMFLMFLQSFIGQDWVEDLTPDHLEQHPSLFPEIIETDRESDIVYKVQKNGKTDRFVFVLLESQSTIDHMMPFRILEYMTRIWRKHIQNTEHTDSKEYQLPPIVPILFYDGEGSWTAHTNLMHKIEECELFKKYIPDFEYLLVDLSGLSFEELEKLKNPQSLILILDKIRTPEDLERLKNLSDEYWNQVKEIIDKYNLWELVREIIYIFMKTKGVENHQIEETLEKIGNKEVKKGMMIYTEATDVKKAKNIGKLEGRKEGTMAQAIRTAKNMLKNKESTVKIKEYTGLSKKEITTLQKELNEKAQNQKNRKAPAKD